MKEEQNCVSVEATRRILSVVGTMQSAALIGDVMARIFGGTLEISALPIRTNCSDACRVAVLSPPFPRLERSYGCLVACSLLYTKKMLRTQGHG